MSRRSSMGLSYHPTNSIICQYRPCTHNSFSAVQCRIPWTRFHRTGETPRNLRVLVCAYKRSDGAPRMDLLLHGADKPQGCHHRASSPNPQNCQNAQKEFGFYPEQFRVPSTVLDRIKFERSEHTRDRSCFSSKQDAEYRCTLDKQFGT